MNLEQEAAWRLRAAQRIQEILAPDSKRHRIDMMQDLSSTGTALLVGTISEVRGSELFLDYFASGLGYNVDLGFWVGLRSRSHFDACAQLLIALFGKPSIRNASSSARNPRDVLVVDRRVRGASYVGVELAYTPELKHPLPDLLLNDIAFFFRAAACVATMSPLEEPNFVDLNGFLGVQPPGYGAVLSSHKCGRCSGRLKSYERSCLGCGWAHGSPNPTITSKHRFDFQQSDT